MTCVSRKNPLVLQLVKNGDEENTRRHLRCPLCGRLARIAEGDLLPAALRPDHSIDLQAQAFKGGGRSGPGHGFEWQSEDPSQDQLTALESLVSTVGGRLREQIGEGRGESPSRSASESALRRENERLKAKLLKRDEVLRLATEQIRTLRAELTRRAP